MKAISKHPLSLPHIRPAKSLPSIPPLKDFDLRFVNQPMPSYNPNHDKFLSHFFQRQNRIRALSSDQRQPTLKTEPTHQLKSEQKGGKETRRKALLTQHSRVQSVKQLSKQDFNDYLETMRKRVASKQVK